MKELETGPPQENLSEHPCGICFTEHETGAKALACCAKESE